jgi:hypothetical protein
MEKGQQRNRATQSTFFSAGNLLSGFHHGGILLWDLAAKKIITETT